MKYRSQIVNLGNLHGQVRDKYSVNNFENLGMSFMTPFASFESYHSNFGTKLKKETKISKFVIVCGGSTNMKK